VNAEFNQMPPVLYPNLTVEANILIRTKKGALTVPTSYITGNNKILLGSGDTAVIVTGIANMQWTEVTAGLEPGQPIYRPAE
jgi:multidrug efflux pump subunit AcrA (membrane-fusion protein)